MGSKPASSVHDFRASQVVEARWAKVLDDWLASTVEFRRATSEEEWRGIDRVANDGGREVTLEYKVDERASDTGNLFIETVSNDRTGRRGWAYSCEAEWLLYFVTPDRVYAFRPPALRAALPDWLKQFKTREANNGRYSTLGVLVPVPVAASVAEYVAHLDREDGPVFEEWDREP